MVRSLTTALLLGTFPLAIAGQETAAKPYVLERGSEWVMKSAHGTDYRIMVSVPEGEPPAGGFPVVYLLDGDELFPAATSILRLQAGSAKLAKHNGIAPGIIVGIGYPGESKRDLDYTPPAPLTEQPETYRNGKPYPPRPAGGADQLFEFIEKQLKPEIGKRHPIDPGQQTLMGNGYGGLFALHVLFTRPGAFQSYVASSPSIWWNGRHILTEEAAFSKKPAAARLFLTVGEGEQSLSKVEAAWPDDEREEHRLKVTRRAMVDSTRELYWRLAKLESPGFLVSFESFAGESHKSVIPVAISHALPFMFPPGK